VRAAYLKPRTPYPLNPTPYHLLAIELSAPRLPWHLRPLFPRFRKTDRDGLLPAGDPSTV